MSYELNSALALINAAINDLEKQALNDRDKDKHCCRLHTAIDEARRCACKIESLIGDDYE